MGSVSDPHKARNWLRVNRYKMPIDGFPEKECDICSEKFKPLSRRGRYCSRRCKNKATRARYQDKFSNMWMSKSPYNFIKSLLNKKNRKDELTVEYVCGLWDQQGGLCALTGDLMTYERGNGRVWTNLSIDRIDSSKGYLVGNVQLVTRKANTIKSDMTMEELYDTCQKILDKR